MKFDRVVNKALIILLYISFNFVSTAWGLTAQQIAQNTFPSVVLLVMEDENGQPVSMGSGFFVKNDIVATNFHVIQSSIGGYAKIVGKQNKLEISGVVGLDKDVDLVLLSIEQAKAPPLTLGDSEQVKVADEIYAIGNPLGLEGTFSKGIISGIRNNNSKKLFQVTAPVSPGSSGGPILNSKGEIIGVAVSTLQEGQNINFAIPVNYLKSLLSNPTPVSPLSKKITSKRQKSAFSSFSRPSTEGILARKFRWHSGGSFSFSLYNKFREPVADIKYLIIFYDDEDVPIDIMTATWWGISTQSLTDRLVGTYSIGQVIPARLARMVTNSIRGATRGLTKKIDIRILDFKFAKLVTTKQDIENWYDAIWEEAEKEVEEAKKKAVKEQFAEEPPREQ